MSMHLASRDSMNLSFSDSGARIDTNEQNSESKQEEEEKTLPT